jgi:hypothetical protein
MRSYDQFERKVIQTGIGYEKLEYRSSEVGRDQLMLLKVHRENGLSQYYEDALLDDAARRRGLADGSIVLDRRLEDFMRALPQRLPHADRPDGPPTRAFIARSLSALLELDTARQALADAQAKTATLEQEVASLGAELATTGEALRLLRGSRLMRWTAPLRRLWYRVR